MDLTFDDFKYPGLVGYSAPGFGTKKPDGESLSTTEHNHNMEMLARTVQPISINPSSNPQLSLIGSDVHFDFTNYGSVSIPQATKPGLRLTLTGGGQADGSQSSVEVGGTLYEVSSTSKFEFISDRDGNWIPLASSGGKRANLYTFGYGPEYDYDCSKVSFEESLNDLIASHPEYLSIYLGPGTYVTYANIVCNDIEIFGSGGDSILQLMASGNSFDNSNRVHFHDFHLKLGVSSSALSLADFYIERMEITGNSDLNNYSSLYLKDSATIRDSYVHNFLVNISDAGNIFISHCIFTNVISFDFGINATRLRMEYCDLFHLWSAGIPLFRLSDTESLDISHCTMSPITSTAGAQCIYFENQNLAKSLIFMFNDYSGYLAKAGQFITIGSGSTLIPSFSINTCEVFGSNLSCMVGFSRS